MKCCAPRASASSSAKPPKRRRPPIRMRPSGKRGWKTAAAAGLGIGSAAVIAALLYANRGKIK